MQEPFKSNLNFFAFFKTFWGILVLCIEQFQNRFVMNRSYTRHIAKLYRAITFFSSQLFLYLNYCGNSHNLHVYLGIAIKIYFFMSCKHACPKKKSFNNQNILKLFQLAISRWPGIHIRTCIRTRYPYPWSHSTSTYMGIL